MKEVDDSFDILIAIIALISILSIAVWAGTQMMTNTEATVTERTTIHNIYGLEVVEPELQAEDALLMFAVADPFTPDPESVVLSVKGKPEQTVTFDSKYMANKDATINKLWDTSFKGNMSYRVELFELDKTGKVWKLRLE